MTRPDRNRRTHALLAAAALLAALTACTGPAPPAHPHYVLGRPYSAGGIWWYPRERPDFAATGLAAVYPSGHPSLTTDGEVFSQDALAVAHPTLPLPSVARLTDLQTGRSLLVRINDRGTPTPRRLVQVTRRVAALLGMPRDGVAEVRLTVLAPASAAAQAQAGGGPHLAISAAPVGAVRQTNLPPPAGMREERGQVLAAVATAPVAAVPPVRLDGSVTQEAPRPGELWVRLDTFDYYEYALIQRAKVIGLHPRIVSVRDGRTELFRVMLGPFTSVAAADAMLDRAIAAGVSDARIVVD